MVTPKPGSLVSSASSKAPVGGAVRAHDEVLPGIVHEPKYYDDDTATPKSSRHSKSGRKSTLDELPKISRDSPSSSFANSDDEDGTSSADHSRHQARRPSQPYPGMVLCLWRPFLHRIVLVAESFRNSKRFITTASTHPARWWTPIPRYTAPRRIERGSGRGNCSRSFPGLIPPRVVKGLPTRQLRLPRFAL